jgi:hypothetical protein
LRRSTPRGSSVSAGPTPATAGHLRYPERPTACRNSRKFDLEQEPERLRLDLQWESLVAGRELVILDEAFASVGQLQASPTQIRPPVELVIG